MGKELEGGGLEWSSISLGTNVVRFPIKERSGLTILLLSKFKELLTLLQRV
jgi:hypothetical protein